MEDGKLPDRDYISLCEVVTYLAEGKALTSRDVQKRIEENPVNNEIRELLYSCEVAAHAEPEKYGGFVRDLPGSKTNMSKWLEACRQYWPPGAERLHILAKQQGKLDDARKLKFNEAENRIFDAAYDGHITLIGVADRGQGQRETIHPIEFSPDYFSPDWFFNSAENHFRSWDNVHVERNSFLKWLGKADGVWDLEGKGDGQRAGSERKPRVPSITKDERLRFNLRWVERKVKFMWPLQTERPPVIQMARDLANVDGCPFSAGTLRQIIVGRYGPAIKLKKRDEDFTYPFE